MRRPSRPFLRASCLVAAAAGLSVIFFAIRLQAGGPEDPRAPATAPLDFPSPDAAAAAFFDATGRNDDARLAALLGSEGSDLVRDGSREDVLRRRRALADAAKERLDFDRSREPEGVLVMLVGAQAHPAGIPLSRGPAGWHLDAAAGRERLLARRVGRNELAAIALCRTVVEAQGAYAASVGGGEAAPAYARRLCSAPGSRDGLWWDDGPTREDPSPLAVRLTPLDEFDERAESGAAAGAFGGYVWRVLAAQGPHAPGGAMNYAVDGRLTGGFAVLAAPAAYRRTGVKTFLAGPDGDLYERDLGEDTLRAARAMEVFDPDDTWTRVEDDGDDDPEDGAPSPQAPTDGAAGSPSGS